MTTYGHTGRMLRIDLSSKTTVVEETPLELRKNYVGGRGFVARLLWERLAPTVEPLGPENIVVIAPGPLSGLLLPASGKVAMGAKSPLTGGYGDSNMGGHFASEIKYAGYDAIMIYGQASAPSYVFIEDDRVEIRDAGELWGKGAIEAETVLKETLGEDVQIASIGPAGERLVRYACISHDFGRQAGRTGVGAVWGSKRLKAIAVRGTKSLPICDPEAAARKGKEMFRECFANPELKKWTPEGTAGVTDWVNEVGAFPTKNFSTGYFEHHKQINGRAILDRILVTDKGCFCCPTPCGKYSRGTWMGREFFVEGPEYESIALLGGNLLIGDIEQVAYANYVCDELGIDSISGGAVIGFAMECFERGIIDEQLVGRTISFGDLDSAIYLLELISRREGIGDILADGVRAAAARWGGGSERFAPHVKGMELSGYESRHLPAMLLAYMTADIGAHHNRAWAITHDVAAGRDKLEGKAAKVIELQHVRPLFDILGLCRLQWVELGFELHHYGELFPLVTGMDYDWDSLLIVAERVYNLTRLFNFRHVAGFGRALDYPPARCMEEPVPSGPTAGKLISREVVDQLLDEYYRLRGWDEDGRPTRDKLEQLGLETD